MGALWGFFADLHTTLRYHKGEQAMEKRNAFIAAAIFPFDTIGSLLERAHEAKEIEEVRPLIAQLREQFGCVYTMYKEALVELDESKGE